MPVTLTKTITIREGARRAARYWFKRAMALNINGHDALAARAMINGGFAARYARQAIMAGYADAEYGYVWGEISVCICCRLVSANGECCESREPRHDRTPLGEIEWPLSLALGGEHAESCANYPEWQGEECDCEEKGFSRLACEGCGSTLAGDRYAATLFDESARPVFFGEA